MATTKDQARAAILDRLTGFTRFHPANASLFADWSVEPGDVLRVENDGTIYDVPVYQMDMRWKGTPTVDVQSTGSKKRPDPSKLNKGSGYGGSRKKEEEEITLNRHHTEITKNNEEISIMAYETGLLPGVKEIFNKNKAYKIGDYVLYGTAPVLTYRFTSPHVAGTEWDPSEVTVVNTQEGRITVTENRITAEVSRALSAESSLSSSLDLKADSATLSTVMDNNGNVTAASVATAINSQTGSSVVRISADKVMIDGTTELSELFTSGANAVNLYVNKIFGCVEGHIENLSSDYIFIDRGGLLSEDGDVYLTDTDLEDAKAVKDLSLTYDSTTRMYTLAWKDYDNTQHSETFNRATAPTIGGGWNGGVYTITSDITPASGSVTEIHLSSSIAQTITRGTGSSSNIYTVGWNIGYDRLVNNEWVRYDTTGRTGSFTVDASAVYNDGHDSVTLSDIGFHNNSSTALQDTEPTESPRWSGGTINGWFWMQQADGKWKNIGYKQWSMPAAATGWRVVDTGNVYTCYCTVGGKTYSGTVSK